MADPRRIRIKIVRPLSLSRRVFCSRCFLIDPKICFRLQLRCFLFLCFLTASKRCCSEYCLRDHCRGSSRIVKVKRCCLVEPNRNRIEADPFSSLFANFFKSISRGFICAPPKRAKVIDNKNNRKMIIFRLAEPGEHGLHSRSKA